jgi:nucleolar protein 56
MDLVTWFGTLDSRGQLHLAGDVVQMIDRLLDQRETEFGVAGIQPDLRNLALQHRIVKSDEEYNRLLRAVAIGLVRRELELLADDEADLLQMIEALDDLNEVVNRLDERLYEWSRLHTEEVVHGEDLSEMLVPLEGVGDLAKAVIDLREHRDFIEKRIESRVSDLAPNLTELAGPHLAARLISRAGSLKRLSEMPSSAIQVMGAEKALFKHLMGKAPSPKHGIIYRHPAVISAPKNLRGRMARAIAGKLAIAARIDYHSGKPQPLQREMLEKRIAEIRRSTVRSK